MPFQLSPGRPLSFSTIRQATDNWDQTAGGTPLGRISNPTRGISSSRTTPGQLERTTPATQTTIAENRKAVDHGRRRPRAVLSPSRIREPGSNRREPLMTYVRGRSRTSPVRRRHHVKRLAELCIRGVPAPRRDRSDVSLTRRAFLRAVPRGDHFGRNHRRRRLGRSPEALWGRKMLRIEAFRVIQRHR